MELSRLSPNVMINAGLLCSEFDPETGAVYKTGHSYIPLVLLFYDLYSNMGVLLFPSLSKLYFSNDFVCDIAIILEKSHTKNPLNTCTRFLYEHVHLVLSTYGNSLKYQ